MKTRILVDHVSDNGRRPYRVQIQKRLLFFITRWDTVGFKEKLEEATEFQERLKQHKQVLMNPMVQAIFPELKQGDTPVPQKLPTQENYTTVKRITEARKRFEQNKEFAIKACVINGMDQKSVAEQIGISQGSLSVYLRERAIENAKKQITKPTQPSLKM